MAQGHPSETLDKAAVILLGTPALSGAMLLILALGSPGSVPYRERSTTIPIAVALIVLAGTGGGFYLAWKHRKERRQELDRRANAGAIRLSPDRRTPRLVDISFSLADQFVLPAGSCILPTQTGPVTVSQVCLSVFAGIQKLEAKGQIPFDPSAVKMASLLVVKYARGGSGELRMSSDLNHLISFHTRRKLWRSLRQLRIGLPALAVPKWAMSIIFILSLAIAFGTTIPLVQYLDEKAPIHTQSTTERTFAEVIVRGGFFGLLLASSIVLTLVFWALFPVFPGSCRTIGHIAAYLPGERPADMPITHWTKELVSSEVRRIIADCLDVQEEQIRPSTPCN